jgi:signal transduction histidine kinase
MNKILIFACLTIHLAFNAFTAWAQETGKPFMTVFTTKEINGHVQNWSIIQDHRGVMYVGDGFGVQEYDGATWRLIEAPNGSFARSLAIDANGRIYVGSSGMLGYLEPDATGTMRYVSLMDYITPEDQVFNYVWSAHTTSEGVYFQTRERLFLFRPVENSVNGEPSESWDVKVWKPLENFGYTFLIDGTLYIQQQALGLTKMAGDSLVPVPGGRQFANDRIHVMLPVTGKPGSFLIGTFNRGLFIWDGNKFEPFRISSDPFLRSGTLYTGALLSDGCYALGTMSEGLFIISPDGTTKLHLTQIDGLLSNTISAMYVDKQKNLWLGMDNGIAVLEYDSPLSKYELLAGNSSNDFLRHGNFLYACANNGIQYLAPGESAFRFASGVKGNTQSFYFSIVKDDLFAVTGGGVYKIEGKNAIPVLEVNSLDFIYTYLVPSKQDPSIIFVGLTSGFAVFRYYPGTSQPLRLVSRIDGMFEYIRYVVESEPGIIWLSPSDAGPMRLTFRGPDFSDPVIEKFDERHGLPSGGVIVYNTVRGVAVLTKRGVYSFDPVNKIFSPDPFYKDVPVGRNPDEGIVRSDNAGNIWVCLGGQTVFFEKQQGGEYRLKKEILSRFADDPAITIYPEHDGHTWFGTTNFVARLTPAKQMPESSSFNALVRCIRITGDSIIYNGASTRADSAGIIIPYRMNGVSFDYAAPYFTSPKSNEFRTRLEGFDEEWSAWKSETHRDYTNLPAGIYRFHVQAKNVFDQESREAIYQFQVMPPWYLTWWAYAFYVLLASGILVLLVTLRTRHLHKRSRQLEMTIKERTAEIQSQKDNIEQLSIIGRDITNNLSIGQIINTVYENVNTLMDASVFGIGIYEKEKQALVFPATKEKGITLQQFEYSLKDEDRLATWCFKNQQEVIINDYSIDYSKYIRNLKTALAGENPESILYLPLQHKGRMTGVITAQSFNKNAYTGYHLHMLRNLATYCAIALENADSFHQLKKLLEELRSTQDKLITQSKLAALGTLTAGIAHEIKNPLNFINNFSGLNAELVDELNENVQREKEKLSAGTITEVEEIISNIKQNSIRIQEHGRRADSIVRSMLRHSRGGAGDRQATDINNLLEEAINLTYHGMRAQDTGFNIKIEKSFDISIGRMELVPQEISRAMLNIISNGCYEAHRKKTENAGTFSPVISVKTEKEGNNIKITIRDNGSGIPASVRQNLFTPFFTTKPAGQGTGLGLSIAWDIIVQQHNGRISYNTEEGEESFTEFIIVLPQ